MGDTQANMIEWKGYSHPKLGVPVFSLYGDEREPTASMLAGLDTVIIDLPDAGARPYTYLWTAVLMMRSCAGSGVSVTILDRPNPIGGVRIEGALLEEAYRSFVGLHPIPMRHGLTIAEALLMINDRENLGCSLDVVHMRGWRRSMFFDETGLPWIMPSPNMPSPATALLYPGMVMLEGTNISEGRGTTRPFEFIGAPWIDPDEFAAELASRDLAGVVPRPVFFRPMWDKYAGELCGGVELHVRDREAFRPVRCGAVIIDAAARMYGDRFKWKPPPYEYEYERLPIDIISGGSKLRETIESGGDLRRLFDLWEKDEKRFARESEPYRLY
jgi:uncharacterized protein YbbC (DUF1343 family)